MRPHPLPAVAAFMTASTTFPAATEPAGLPPVAGSGPRRVFYSPLPPDRVRGRPADGRLPAEGLLITPFAGEARPYPQGVSAECPAAGFPPPAAGRPFLARPAHDLAAFVATTLFVAALVALLSGAAAARPTHDSSLPTAGTAAGGAP